jgi:hypothetical protein
MAMVNSILRMFPSGIITLANLWTGCGYDLIATLHGLKKANTIWVHMFVMRDAVSEEYG